MHTTLRAKPLVEISAVMSSKPEVGASTFAWMEYSDALGAENERLRAVLGKWRTPIDHARQWFDGIGNERDAKGFAAMLADFDEVLDSSGRTSGPSNPRP